MPEIRAKIWGFGLRLKPVKLKFVGVYVSVSRSEIGVASKTPAIVRRHPMWTVEVRISSGAPMFDQVFLRLLCTWAQNSSPSLI